MKANCQTVAAWSRACGKDACLPALLTPPTGAFSGPAHPGTTQRGNGHIDAPNHSLRVGGMWLVPSRCARTHSTWLTPIRACSNDIAEAAIYNRQTRARPAPTSRTAVDQFA